MAEPNRLLRHKPTGILYVYQEAFAARPDFEEIIDVESRVIPDAVEAPPVKSGRKTKTPDPSVASLLEE